MDFTAVGDGVTDDTAAIQRFRRDCRPTIGRKLDPVFFETSYYVGAAQNGGGQAAIKKFDPRGNLLETFRVERDRRGAARNA